MEQAVAPTITHRVVLIVCADSWNAGGDAERSRVKRSVQRVLQWLRASPGECWSKRAVRDGAATFRQQTRPAVLD